jgi:hypothetical protein
MLTRSKTASEAGETVFIRFIKQLTVAKELLVKLWLAKEAVKRFFVSVARPLRSFGAIILGGLWNAYLLSGSKGPPDTIVLPHVAKGGDADFSKFAARVARAVGEGDGAAAKYLDLLFLAEDAASIAEYMTTARFFNKKINLHVGRDIQAYRSIAPTIVVPGFAEEARDLDSELLSNPPIVITPGLIGTFRAPTFYSNLAREFLKIVDSRKKFCVVCIAKEWPVETTDWIACFFSSVHTDWRFIIIPVDGSITCLPASTTEDLIWPTCAGLEFGTRLALVTEADALIGPSCLFSLAAILSGRQVTLLESGQSIFAVSSDLSNVRAVNSFGCNDLVSELKSLIERVDEQEFRFPMDAFRE